MTNNQHNLLNDLKHRFSYASILEMDKPKMEREVGYPISWYTYDIVQSYSEDLLLEDELNKLIPLFEARVNTESSLELTKRAIKDRHYMAVYYIDADGRTGFRLIEPYVVGKGYKTNGVISEEHKDDYYLRCYVVKDAKKDSSVPFSRNKSYSYSREEPYWRTLRLDRLKNIVIIKRKIKYYRKEYTGGSDKNIVNRLEWINISEFRGVNPEKI